MQRTIIRATREAPSALSLSLEHPASISANRRVTEEAYGVEAYGKNLHAIYLQLQKAKPGTVHYANGDLLLDAFLNPARFNLLRT